MLCSPPEFRFNPDPVKVVQGADEACAGGGRDGGGAAEGGQGRRHHSELLPQIQTG